MYHNGNTFLAADEMQAQLIPVDGGSPIEITRDSTLVGRKPEVCDLVIDRSSISKIHCLIVKTDGLLFIRDLASTNGTKVNGQKITRGALLPGDELSFASVRFQVHLGPSKSAEPGPHHPTEMLTSFPDVSNGDEELILLDDPPAADDRPVLLDPQRESESDVRLLPDDSVA